MRQVNDAHHSTHHSNFRHVSSLFMVHEPTMSKPPPPKEWQPSQAERLGNGIVGAVNVPFLQQPLSGAGLLAPQPQPQQHSLLLHPPPQYDSTQWQPQIYHQHSTIYVKEEGTEGEVNVALPPPHRPRQHAGSVPPLYHPGQRMMPHQPHPSTNATAYAAGYQPSERSRQREFNPQQHPLRPPHRPRQHAGIVPPPHHLPSETTSVDSAKLFRQLRDYKCQSSGCNCRIKIARVNCNGISGLLGYQLATPGTGLIYEHDQNAHKLFPHEEQSQGLRTLLQKNSTSKFSLFALSVEQKEFIMDYGLTTGTISQQKDAVSTMTFMARMNQMRCTPEQLYTPEKFLSAVKNWVGNRKKQGDYFFSNQWGKCSMSAHQLKELLDLLKTSPDDRTSPPDVSTYPNNPHLLTPEYHIKP